MWFGKSHNSPTDQRDSEEDLAKYNFPIGDQKLDDFVLKELSCLDSFKHFLLPPIRPGSGGLALFWDQDVDLQILSSTKNYIDTHISYKGRSFHSMFIYGEPEIANRASFWDHISSFTTNRDTPWMVTGDLNEIVDNSEKSGGPLRAEGSFCTFRNFISQANLFDLKHTGNFFSWRGKRHNHLIHCRLDRTLINSSWSDAYPSGRCHYLDFEGSDHRPTISYIDPNQKKGKRLFRYDRRLKEVPEIKIIIEEVWNARPNNTTQQRLSDCRHAISQWSKQHYNNNKIHIAKLKEEINETMAKTDGDDAVISRLNAELLLAYKKEEEFWRQRSRLTWLAAGDKNSGYFHAVCKGKRARNRISVLENASGVSLFEEDQIVCEITNYFQYIFSSVDVSESSPTSASIVDQAITPSVSEDMNEQLTLVPTVPEIRDALFSIHPDKAPGPDGFSACFFHSNWEAVRPAITRDVQQFFRSGILPDGINATM